MVLFIFLPAQGMQMEIILYLNISEINVYLPYFMNIVESQVPSFDKINIKDVFHFEVSNTTIYSFYWINFELDAPNLSSFKHVNIFLARFGDF